MHSKPKTRNEDPTPLSTKTPVPIESNDDSIISEYTVR